MSGRRRIAFATREVHPFRAGGIAPVVTALALELSPIAEVTVFTSSAHREASDALGGPAVVFGPGVELCFVDEPVPDAERGYASHAHDWSARLFEAIADRFGSQGPDLIEFCDYLAEGFATVQARRTGDPLLRDTRVVVRTHTTAEITSVLNGHMRDDNETVAVFEAERYCLRHADRVLVPGGDILGTYVRRYGADGLAPAARVLDAFLEPAARPDAAGDESGGPLRMLFLGRLERRKGVATLLRALGRAEPADWRLTLVGGDTATSPLGQSMREFLEIMADGDERISFRPPVAREQVGALLAAHDLVIVPSLWECWPNVVREAYAANRPVVATPVGGLTEMVEDGTSGWLADGTGSEALLRALEPLLRAPDRVRESIADGAPGRAYRRIVDPERTRREYATLLGRPESHHRVARARAPEPVSAVVPYFRMEAYLRSAVESLRAQTRRVDEIVLVDDGCFRVEDEFLWELAAEPDVTLVAQPNSGLGAARNLGMAAARGAYILPLDPDNELEPEFVERCLYAFEHTPALAYVTTWCLFVDEEGEPLGSAHEGHTPLGNWTRLVDRNNWAGDATALVRREVFERGLRYSTELTSYEDWFLYRQMHHAGLFGDVIPRRLFRYRVRRDSMLRTVGLARTERIYDEMAALLDESRTAWVAPR